MRAGRELRRLIIARIEAEVPALAGAVYDKATEGTAYPYVTMGPSYRGPRDVECIKARLITLQIDVWHSQSSKGACEDLVDDIDAALDGWSDTNALTMHPLRVTLARVMDDPNGDVHGVIQVETLAEAEPPN